ncbi:MAG: YhjD/YihY/BrkB family envelope integrity protein [Pseudomonadota bacterium]|nr:YhjD/YihY/BrkB family envelope integrity protein [Pseudomonadota bacterium]MDP1905184.1 YhjD/YihY/BrkB family envelope integrity protein [Pseudomonadota bacterium]MDP2352956.1 YhjD/YihY/BrkB family envelope integrity protein [Pseudomonadota bacterium]
MSVIRLQENQQNSLDWLLQTAYTAWRLFIKNELLNHAAATTFYFLLSAAPLVLLLTYGAQYLAQLAETSNLASMLLAALYDQFQLEQLASLGLIPQQTAIAAGGVGLLTLLLSSRGLVNALQSAFRVIFPDDAKRNFVFKWVLPLIIIPVAFALVSLTVATQAVINFLANVEMLGAGRIYLFNGLNLLARIGLVWGLLYVVLRQMPLQHPPRWPTFVVSGLATLTLSLLYLGFGHFFHIEKYQAVYGALGGVVFVLIGAFLACMTFYFWAQFLYALTKVDVAALEKLFLIGEGTGASKLDGIVFGRANRLLAKYGRTFAVGETLIREGDTSREAFFLYAGKVSLFKEINGQERHLAELGEGELFGEMAYLLGEHRTATVRAQTEVTALVLPPEMLEELMRYSAPLARRIVGSLAGRLMRMNKVAQG